MRTAMMTWLDSSGESPTSPRHTWRQAPHVIACAHDDSLTLLSLRSNRYFSLDSSSALIWTRLVQGLSVTDTARLVADECGMADRTGDVAADVERFAGQMAHAKLLRPATLRQERALRQSRPTRPFRATAPTAPGVVVSALRLLIVSCALRVIGLGRTMAFVTRRASVGVAQTPEHSGQDTRWVPAAVLNLAMASTAVPFPAKCLERSVALLWMASRRGLAAHLRIGVLPRPFNAHAWVEIDGRPVNENPEYIELFRLFPPIDLAS
jgi:hypothetical protein